MALINGNVKTQDALRKMTYAVVVSSLVIAAERERGMNSKEERKQLFVKISPEKISPEKKEMMWSENKAKGAVET